MRNSRLKSTARELTLILESNAYCRAKARAAGEPLPRKWADAAQVLRDAVPVGALYFIASGFQHAAIFADYTAEAQAKIEAGVRAFVAGDTGEAAEAWLDCSPAQMVILSILECCGDTGLPPASAWRSDKGQAALRYYGLQAQAKPGAKAKAPPSPEPSPAKAPPSPEPSPAKAPPSPEPSPAKAPPGEFTRGSNGGVSLSRGQAAALFAPGGKDTLARAIGATIRRV